MVSHVQRLAMVKISQRFTAICLASLPLKIIQIF